MVEPHEIDWKLRAVFLVPTLVVGLALILVDRLVVDFMPSWLPSLLVFSALISLLVVERKRRRSRSE